MKNETSKKQNEVVSKVDKKQLIVGIIILIVAILTLAYAFMTMNNKAGEEQAAVATPVVEEKAVVAKEPAVKEEPVAKAEEAKAEVAPATESKAAVEEKPHVSLTFTATAEKDVEYVISYTTDESPYFNGKNVVTQPIKKGTANYTVAFPVEEIINFRLDMSIDAGKMSVSNFKLIGSQEEDISNPMYYEMMGRIEVAPKNTFIVNDKGLPTLIYRPDFKEPQVKEEPAKAEAKAEETAPKAEAKEEAKK